MSNYITISKEHGVNPSIGICPICGQESGLILYGISYKGKNGKTAKAPMYSLGDYCDDCKDKMKTHIAVIEMSNNERTNRYVWAPKEDITVDCPKGIAFMIKEEFEKLFKDDNN